MSSGTSDRRLIQRVTAGDTAAWGKFVAAYQGLVISRLRSAARETGRRLSPTDLDDLCVEVFTGLIADDFAALRQFRGDASLATWLSVITRRAFLEHLAQPCDAPNDSSADNPEDPAGIRFRSCAPDTPEYIAPDELPRLLAHLHRLRDHEARLVRFFYMQELSYREISDQTGLPPEKLGPMLQDAVANLRLLENESSDNNIEVMRR